MFLRNSTFDNLMNDYYEKEEKKLFVDFDMMVIDAWQVIVVVYYY